MWMLTAYGHLFCSLNWISGATNLSVNPNQENAPCFRNKHTYGISGKLIRYCHYLARRTDGYFSTKTNGKLSLLSDFTIQDFNPFWIDNSLGGIIQTDVCNIQMERCLDKNVIYVSCEYFLFPFFWGACCAWCQCSIHYLV